MRTGSKLDVNQMRQKDRCVKGLRLAEVTNQGRKQSLEQLINQEQMQWSRAEWDCRAGEMRIRWWVSWRVGRLCPESRLSDS